MYPRLRRYRNHIDANKLPQYKKMSKFEKAKAIGIRATEIEKGKPPLVAVKNETDPMRLAEIELEHNVLPVIIRSSITTGGYDLWELDSDQKSYKDLFVCEGDISEEQDAGSIRQNNFNNCKDEKDEKEEKY